MQRRQGPGGAWRRQVRHRLGVLSGPAIERLQASVIDKLVLLDTIPVEGEKAIDKIETLSVADLFAEAIRRIYDETAISDLYN